MLFDVQLYYANKQQDVLYTFFLLYNTSFIICQFVRVFNAICSLVQILHHLSHGQTPSCSIYSKLICQCIIVAETCNLTIKILIAKTHYYIFMCTRKHACKHMGTQKTTYQYKLYNPTNIQFNCCIIRSIREKHAGNSQPRTRPIINASVKHEAKFSSLQATTESAGAWLSKTSNSNFYITRLRLFLRVF